MTYRTGNHWGVTIVREGERTPEGHIVGASELVAVVVNGDQALAERICALLNGIHTPDVDYLHGVNDALTEVRRQLTAWSELADTGEQLTDATVHGMLRDTAAGLGLDEDAPSGPRISSQTAETTPVVPASTPKSAEPAHRCGPSPAACWSDPDCPVYSSRRGADQ